MMISRIIQRRRQLSPVCAGKIGAGKTHREFWPVLEPRSNAMKLGVMKSQLPQALPKQT